MINKEDLQNLEAVFSLARQTAATNEEQLIGIINFKKILFDKFKEMENPAPKEPKNFKESDNKNTSTAKEQQHDSREHDPRGETGPEGIKINN